MAEFQEVMAGFARMCKYMNRECYENNCPLAYTNFRLKDVCNYTAEDIQEAVEIIAKWVAEHPEPEYPSWLDWLMEQGIIPDGYTAKHSTEPGVRAAKFFVTIKGFEPIPADIAQKLGIEPKR